MAPESEPSLRFLMAFPVLAFTGWGAVLSTAMEGGPGGLERTTDRLV
jgi:hypothetical protein